MDGCIAVLQVFVVSDGVLVQQPDGGEEHLGVFIVVAIITVLAAATLHVRVVLVAAATAQLTYVCVKYILHRPSHHCCC